MYKFGLRLENCVILFLVFNILALSMTSALDYRKYGEQMVRQARGDDDYHGAMWFGPRLGKRSGRLTEDDRMAWARVLEAADVLKYYYGQLPEDPEIDPLIKKIQFTPKLGRSATDDEAFDGITFTPRLGRQAAGDSQSRVTPSDQNFRSAADKAESHLINFSPRLGRSTLHFSPRLGRQIDYGLLPEEDSVRVVRSTTDKKSNEAHST